MANTNPDTGDGRTLQVTRPPMTGPDVLTLQKLLNQKGFACDIDGVYGPDTGGKVVEAKRRLHYPKNRQKNIAGPLFRRLLALLPDVPRLLLPEFFKPTHDTAGLPNFPAVDCFAPAGTSVGAPENGQLTARHLIQWDQTKRVGGWTCYFQGDSGNTYFDTHFGRMNAQGRYRKGEAIGTVGAVPNGWWASHIHHGKHKGRFFPDV